MIVHGLHEDIAKRGHRMIGTYPQMKIDRLEAEIERLRTLVATQEKVIRKWGIAYDLPLDISQNYVSNRVEGEGPMGYYGDV